MALAYVVDVPRVDCPDELALRALVIAQLGFDPFEPLDAPSPSARPGGSPTRVSVRIASAPRSGARDVAALEAALIWTDDRGRWRGERTIAPAPGSPESRDCAALIRGVAFTLAVQLQLRERPPAATTVDPEPAPAPPEPAPPVPAPAAATTFAAPPEAPATREHAAKWLLSVGPSLTYGLTPDASVQGRLALTVLFARLSFDVGVQAGLTSETRVGEQAAFRAQPWLMAAGACVGTGLSLCALGKLGQLRVRGIGVDAPATDAGLLGQAGMAVVFRRALGARLYALAQAELLGTVSQWSVLLNDVEVWSTPRVAASAALALGARFR